MGGLFCYIIDEIALLMVHFEYDGVLKCIDHLPTRGNSDLMGSQAFPLHFYFDKREKN